MEKEIDGTEKSYIPFKRSNSFKYKTSVRNKERNVWRSTSLSKLVNYPRVKSNSWVLSSTNFRELSTHEVENRKKKSVLDLMTDKLLNKVSGVKPDSLVIIVLIEAKELPPAPEDGETHNVYCNVKLGSESYRTKAVANTIHPEWRERFVLGSHKNDLLKISVWEKGKEKNFMGNCILDLSLLEKERTHDIWQHLDDGYGLIHLSVTICLSSISSSSLIPNFSELEEVGETQYSYDFKNSWDVVGSLYVNIFGARGLVGKLDGYCILELGNERVQTPKGGSGAEPTWNKSYVFRVKDVTSTLDIKVYGRSFTSALLYEPIGKISIPLLMIENGEHRWYALKDKNKKYIAKGNCPRVRLQMTLIWNPVKGALRLFRPKPIKHVKNQKKYDIALIYSNVDFIGKLFDFLNEINESFKRLFEWDDPEMSFVALGIWLVFWYYFRFWMIPLLLLIPFTYHLFFHLCQDNNQYNTLRNNLHSSHGDRKNISSDHSKNDKRLSGKVQHLQHTTVVILNGIAYISSLAERLNNLISFKVPFLSYLTMILLIFGALTFYFVPYNYLLMILGIYKYGRKYLNPGRVLNNDLIDFLSRIPDKRKLNEWKKLSVPEPIVNQASGKLARSISTEVLY